MCNIVAPTFGVVESVQKRRRYTLVSIYIRGPNDDKQDDHRIFSPCSGSITRLQAVNGQYQGGRFMFDPVKRGHLNFTVEDVRTDGERCKAQVAIEVGSGYVTNEIAWYGMDEVEAGQVLGTIVIAPGNSRAFLCLPSKYRIHVKVGSEVTGGVTIMARSRTN